MQDNAQKTVLAFLTAINDLDFKTARVLVQPEMKFEGVMGTRDGADSYFTDMEKMQLKYDVKKIFSDGDDVSVFYDILISGKNIFCAGWYHLKNNKIDLMRVIFDPRPLLGNSK
jgi:hypothetical protein